ncbi:MULTISPECIES: hypothetical protein [Arenibacter]|uniref:hypothetical protein n=1 Tax=Arenibacter TaxID=178469 RepID=UPI0004DEDCFF|nr:MULTISPECIES: hypothetical protein [Arenibacter]GBF19519.1 hypothetical protein C21_01687 [Arenibacter sp. NBRC 103722]
MGIDVRDFPDTVQEYFESINSMVVFQEAFKGGPNNPFINDLRKVWREELERQIIENETPTISSGYTEMFGAHLSQLIIIYSDLYCLIVAEEKDKNKYIRKIERNSNNLKSVVEININNIYYPEYYKTQVNSIQQFVNSIGVTWSTSPICGFYSASIEKLSELTRNGDRNKLLETVHDGPRVSRIVDWSLVHFINRDFLCASKRLIHLTPKVKTRVQKYGVSLEFQVFNIDGFEYIIERDETGPGRFMVANFEYIDKWLKRYAFLLNEQKLIAEDDNTIFIKIMHEASNLDSTFIKPIARHLQDIIINIHSFHRPPFDPTTFKILGNLEVLALIKENLIGWWEYDIYDKYIDSWNGFWLDLRTALNKMNISEFIKFKDILVSEISRYNIESASNGFYLGNNPWGIDLLEMPSKIDSFCTNDINQKISLEMLKVKQIRKSDLPTKTPFDEELATLRKSENKFNKGIPMNIVVNHFLVLTQKKGRDNNPILSEENFLQFIKLGFLDQPDIKPQKFNCESSQKGRIIKLFYGFYDIAVSDYRLLNKTDPFIDLILKCFTNWDRSSIKAFFKRNKVKGVL